MVKGECDVTVHCTAYFVTHFALCPVHVGIIRDRNKDAGINGISGLFYTDTFSFVFPRTVRT